MPRRLPSPPVLRFYAYSVASRATFSYPVFVLFFRSRGLSLGEIGLVEATFTVVVLLAEAPTGYVGDRLGRRDSVLLGAVLSGVGAVGYALAHSLPAFLAVSALRAVAGAFRSGATDAWLYDALAAEDGGDEFAHVRGRAGSLGLLAHGGAAVAGGALYAVHPLLPWAGDAAAAALAALVVLTATEPAPAEAAAEEAGFGEVLRVARRTLSRRTVGAFVVYTGLLFGLLNTVEIFVQPVAVEVVGVPPASLGLVYAGFTLVSAALSARAGRIRELVGVRGWFLVVAPALGGVLVAVAALPWLAIPAFFAARGVGAVSRPLAGQYLNDRTETAGRATVLSGASMVRSLFTAPLNVAGGALAGAVALPLALGGLGAALAVGSLAVVAWRVPVESGAARPDD